MTLVLSLVFCFFSFADQPPHYFFDKDLPVGKGTLVEIVDYDSRLGGVFQMVSVKEPGEGFFYTRKAYLKASIKKITAEMLKNPKALVGKKFKLDQKLETVQNPPLSK